MTLVREAPPMPNTPGPLVMRAIYGSFAHGTATPTSDEDWRGVYQLPNDALLGLGRPKLTHEEPPDQVFWELGHFCSLLLKGNPNIVGMLYAPDDCIDLQASAILPLFDGRQQFLHRATAGAYMGWIGREMRDLVKLPKGHAKRLSHVVRLMGELEDILRYWTITVRPEGERLERIMAVKTGTMPYGEAEVWCGVQLLDLELLYQRLAPRLPEPPRNWTQTYLLATRERYGR